MIQIDPRITQIPGFDERCLWLLYKMTQVKMNYENTHPKLATLEKWTGWEKKKVMRVVEQLVEIGLLEVEKRWKKGGGQNSNNYKITTKLIHYLVGLEGAEFSDENHESQNSTLESDHESQNGHGDESQNGTHNIVNSNSLYTSSTKRINTENFSKKNEIETWKPNSVYAQTVERVCPDIDELAIEAELLKFKTHFQNNWPQNPDKNWLSWCQRVNQEYRERRLKKERADEANELAKQRIKEFHTKKQENINKVGTKTKSPPSRDYDPVFTNRENMKDKFKNANITL